jgi:hypothetical protein
MRVGDPSTTNEYSQLAEKTINKPVMIKVLVTNSKGTSIPNRTGRREEPLLGARELVLGLNTSSCGVPETKRVGWPLSAGVPDSSVFLRAARLATALFFERPPLSKLRQSVKDPLPIV